MSKTISVINDSNSKLLFSCFKAGDNGIPFDATWIEPNRTGKLKTGDFASLSTGVQAQEGGRWIGGDPKDPPFTDAGGTLTVTITKLPS
ncbi:hypothetical protein [Marinobacterium rhizophilum]|uniref:Uncharacterized protein n=1 Tax=Marinobacterium rhizophilum TaxID=420402 RepID=A0ABY5HL09_9GAMM|nr:hypothetical protein [Marinobacterium rhizophilum]UTW13078.1 hypothetical protein KDW95_05300 [Marinobacterium rhizophilum]